MDLTTVTWFFGIIIYVALALIALWGAFCVILVWFRVAQLRFRSEQQQGEFLDTVEGSLAAGDFDGAIKRCDEDPRAVSQLALLALANRGEGYSKVRNMVADHFQRDVLADLEYRLDWVYTVIKAAPMVGLLGTVIGMMGAFGKLWVSEQVSPKALAGDIMLALITTACGLAIAIPLVFSTASIRVQIGKMEDLVSVGLTRFFAALKTTIAQAPRSQDD